MIQIEGIGEALGNVRWRGHELRCACPICSGPFKLEDGGSRGVLAFCFSGCAPRMVYAELRKRGLVDKRKLRPVTPEERAARNAKAEAEDRRKKVEAKDIWDGTRPARRTAADDYLRVRGCDFDRPYLGGAAWREVRFHPGLKANRARWPSLVAKISDVDGNGMGVQVTYLARLEIAKAPIDSPRKTFGRAKGGGVRIGRPDPTKWYPLAEGLETVLTVMQSAELPAGCATLSANGMRNLILPPEAAKVLICADCDANGTGQKAASAAAQRFLAEGRKVRIAMPPQGFDFNDVMLEKCPVAIEAAMKIIPEVPSEFNFNFASTGPGMVRAILANAVEIAAVPPKRQRHKPELEAA